MFPNSNIDLLVLVLRAAATLAGIGIGVWIAWTKAREHRALEARERRALGLAIVALTLVQGIDALLSVGEKAVAYVSTVIHKHVHDVTLSDADQSLDARNELGATLWRRSFSGSISKAVVVDLDGQPGNEVVVGVGGKGKDTERSSRRSLQPGSVVVGVGGKGKDTGRLIAYDEGGRINWEFNANAPPSPYRGGTSNLMAVKGLELYAPAARWPKEIAVIAGDVNWFAARLVVLTADGKVKGQYWHPGQLQGVRVVPDGVGTTRIVSWGVNNGLRRTPLGNQTDDNFSVVFAFKSDKVSGFAPPRNDNPKWTGGSQDWYVAILPQGVKISQIDVVPPGANQSRPLLAIWLECGFIFYLTLDGQPSEPGRADHAKCDPEVTKLVSISPEGAISEMPTSPP